MTRLARSDSPTRSDSPSVLYVIDSLAPGGAERSLADIAPHLVDRGVSLEIAVLHERPGYAGELRRRGVPVTVVGGTNRREWRRGVRRLVADRRPDLVHTTLFESDLAGRVAAVRSRVPVVSSLVSTPYGPDQAAEAGVRRTRLRAAQAADAVTARAVRRFHAVSAAAAASATARLGVAPGRIEVIPRGRDLARLGARSEERRCAVRRHLGVAPDVGLVLAVARQEPQKGLDVLLHALPALRVDHPGVVVLVAGPEGRATAGLDRLATELGLAGVVRRLGRRDDVADLLCAADVLALPSRREGLPGAVLEAMALATPIVATDLPSVRDAVPDDDHALLVAPGDPVALARALGDVLSRPGPARERARTASARFAARYDIGAVAAAMVAFYAAALDGPRR